MPDLKPVNDAITQAFNALPVKMAGRPARLMLLAIHLQEDPQQLRRQMGNGPAKSLWQGEKTGGMCSGVFNHPATKRHAQNLASLRGVAGGAEAVWNAIETDDVLAAGLARLLLWSDPSPMPQPGEVREAWTLYLATWRPGAYHNGTPAKQQALYTKWQLNYAKALDQLNELA